MQALHYEESLSSWEVAAYARPQLSIRITDGCYRLVTHIPLPVGLAIEAREAWQQARREQAFCRFCRIQEGHTSPSQGLQGAAVVAMVFGDGIPVGDAPSTGACQGAREGYPSP